MAGSTQNSARQRAESRSGGAILEGGRALSISSQPLWFAVILGFLVTATVAIPAVAISRERAKQRQLSSMREGLELLRLEQDVSVVASRFLTTTTMHMYAGGLTEDVRRTREAFRASLLTARATLEGGTPSVAWRPIHGDMRTAVRGAVDTFDEPRSHSELISWVDQFLSDFSRVRPTDNLGEWTAVLEVATWVQEASFVARGYLDGAMARLWKLEGRAPVDSTLLNNFQVSLAALRQIVQSHGAAAAAYTPFKEYLEIEPAEEAGLEFAEVVRALKECPIVRRIEGDMPFLLGLSEERSFASIEELYGQIDGFARHLEEEAKPVQTLAVEKLELAFRKSERHAVMGRLGGMLAIVLTFFLSIRLVQRRRQFESQLRSVAEHDVLTGLGNRYTLFAQGPPRLADPACGGFGLVHLDLDDFKSINDQFGHHVGDAALIEFADACRDSIRSTTDIVVRTGGDEFVILLFDLEDPEAETRAVIDRITARLSEPVELEGHRLLLPASAGFAVSEEPADLQDLLIEADLALLTAKERGRNESELFGSGLRRTLVRELETAMSNGELRCAFQPQFDLETGRVSGLEALMRWYREDRSKIEAIQLVRAVVWLGQSRRWLRIAMQDVEAAWREIGDVFDGRIWINLAGRDLEEADADELVEILSDTAVPLDRLGVELTEPIVRPDLAETVAKLRALRQAGLAVALDDVGDDRMPLLHVTELPIDVVKLDRSLVSRMDVRPERRQVVESIVSLCRGLSLEVVAEGVETAPEEALLRRLGVRYAQGFRFARAIALRDMASLRLIEERGGSRRTEDVA